MGNSNSRQSSPRASANGEEARRGGVPLPLSRSGSGDASPKRNEADVSVHVGHIPTRSILETLQPNDPLDNPFLQDRMNLTGDTDRLLIVMVGLPARGKSIISHKLSGFLNWRGCEASRVFSVGEARRAATTADGSTKNTPASFFNGNMAIASAVRELVAMETLQSALNWLDEGHPRQEQSDRARIAIFDATNSTPKRRQAVSAAAAERGAAVVFLESMCADVHVIKRNMLLKVRTSPDYAGMEEAKAITDLTQRIDLYEDKYETLQDSEGAFIRLYDLNSKVSTHNIFGRMSKRVLPFLLATHAWPRPVTLLATPPDGDAAGLSRFVTDVLRATASAAFRKTNKLCRPTAKLQVLASTHDAATTLAAAIAKEGHWPLEVSHTPLLNGGAGAPGADARWSDEVQRLESIVLDLEASMQPVLVLAPSTPLRLLRAYLLGLDVASSMRAPLAPGAAALDGGGRSMLEFDIGPTGKAEERVTPLTSTTLKVDLAGAA